MKKVSILGSTGSIGTQALEVIAASKGLEAVAISANTGIGRLEEQIRRFRPRFAAVADEKCAADLKVRVADTDTRVAGGAQALRECAAYPGADITLAAIVGIAGLEPTIAAIRARKSIALANKETLVTAGDLVMGMIREQGVSLLPVDSEHSAIFQAISNQGAFVKRIILTASGGPFFGKTRGQLKNVGAKDALRHPTWSMGAKITVDSATLVNKGLEVIEATHLFNVGVQDIDVCVHRQSVVHSMVEFCDNSVIAQLGPPDMKLPIAYALHYPQRAAPVSEPLDLKKIGSLTFCEPDHKTFPAIEMAKAAAAAGGTMPCVFNGANEAAVAEFLAGRCGFLDIYDKIERAMTRHEMIKNPTLDDIKQSDLWARGQVAG